MQGRDERMACQCANSIYTTPAPGSLGGQSLILTEHEHQPAYRAGQMTLHKRNNTLTIYIRHRFDDSIVREISKGTIVGNVDIPYLFAIIVDCIHDIDSQF